MSALRHGAFRTYFAAFFLSNVGTWMHNFAQTWLMYRLTHRAIDLGYLGLVFALPMTLITPLGGALADRFPRAKLLAATQTLSAIVALVIMALVATGTITRAHLLVGQFILALLLSVDNPTRQSMVAELVPKSDLASALALNASIFTGAALLGPMLGGLLLGKVGPEGLFAMNAVSFVFPLASLPVLHRKLAQANALRSRGGTFDGMAHALRDVPLRNVLALGVTTALFGRSYQQMLPVFSEVHFHRGAEGYATFLSAGGLGAIAGALVLSAFSRTEHRERIVASGVVCTSASLVAFAWAPQFAWAVVAIFLAAASAVIATTSMGTLIQVRVPPELRGRVVSLHVVTVVGLPFLGSLLLALLANYTSPAKALCLFASMSAVAAFAWLLSAKGHASIRRTDGE